MKKWTERQIDTRQSDAQKDKVDKPFEKPTYDAFLKPYNFHMFFKYIFHNQIDNFFN